MKHFYISFSILFIANTVFSQGKTNVDTSYFKPNLAETILTNLKYRNGDNIIISKNQNEWNLNNEKNIPTVFINGTGKNLEYYYNYRAVKDERNIFPFGYRQPTFNEIDSSLFLIETKNFTYSTFKLKFTYGSIDENGIIPSESDNVYFWVNNKFKDNIEYWNTLRLKKNDMFFVKELSPDLKVNGHVVRAIEDLSELIKIKTYDYKLLMPNETKKVISKINELFQFTNFDFKVNIDFNNEGKNVSKISDYNTNNLNTQLILLNTFLNKIEKPLYHGQNVIAKSTLKIKFENKKNDIRSANYKYTFDSDVKKLNKLNLNLTKLLNDAQLKLFSPKVEAYSQKLIVNDSLYNSYDKKYLKGIKSRGILFSTYSIIPGLGVLNVDPIRKLNVGTKMIHFSIPLGILSLGSIIYSSILYNDYRTSSDFSTSKFKQANTFHKVFLTTATAYTILGLIDFTMTFSIGMKNNKLTRAINNEINNNYNGGLLLN